MIPAWNPAAKPQVPESPNAVTLAWYPALERSARPIPRPRPYPIFLPRVAQDLHFDRAEAFVRVRLRIVGNGVRVAHILADILERLHLLLPRARPVGFAAGALRDAAEDAARNRVLVHFARG